MGERVLPIRYTSGKRSSVDSEHSIIYLVERRRRRRRRRGGGGENTESPVLA